MLKIAGSVDSQEPLLGPMKSRLPHDVSGPLACSWPQFPITFIHHAISGLFFLPLLEADSGLGRSPSLPVLWVAPGGRGVAATDWRWPQGTEAQGELQMMGGAGTGPHGWKAFSKYSLNIY